MLQSSGTVGAGAGARCEVGLRLGGVVCRGGVLRSRVRDTSECRCADLDFRRLVDGVVVSSRTESIWVPMRSQGGREGSRDAQSVETRAPSEKTGAQRGRKRECGRGHLSDLQRMESKGMELRDGFVQRGGSCE